jgi:hypothetical protein
MKQKTKIIFTNVLNVSEKYSPKPASNYIPDWYKEMSSYIGEVKKPDGKGITTATIKRCMPVFDVINSGYIIPTPCDIWVTQVPISEQEPEKKQPYYEWSNLDVIQFHIIEQAPKHPNNTGHTVAYPKWINPWSIKTPPGYSVLFTQPFHRDSLFTILPGVVDTDTYTAPVNFPFVLNDINFEGLIPAGTPMAQVIPFKRDAWEMKIGNEDDLKKQDSVIKLLQSKMFDSYKTHYRQTKQYK